MSDTTTRGWDLGSKLAYHSIPEPNSGCFLWLSACDHDGYGFLKFHGKQMRAHRLAYELKHGTIATGMVIDHLCRTPFCVNPDHMEAVTPRENTMRGNNFYAINAKKTHCKCGHEFTPENTRFYKTERYCAECHRAKARVRRLRV